MRKLEDRSEGAVDKAIVHARIPLELMFKVNRRFRKEGMSESDALVAALGAAAGDQKLTKAEYDEINRIITDNYRERMVRRELRRKSRRR